MLEVLILADDTERTEPLERMLRQTHVYYPIVCKDTATLDLQLRGRKPSEVAAILVDIMQHPDGAAYVQRLHSAYPDIPIVPLLRESMLKVAAQALQTGALDFLTHPVSEEGLRTVLSRLPASRRGSFPLPTAFMHKLPTGFSSQDAQPPQNSTLNMLDSEGNLRPLHEMEAEIIAFALAHYNGHMSEVARRLGIGRSTLYRKVSEMHIPTQRFAS